MELKTAFIIFLLGMVLSLLAKETSPPQYPSYENGRGNIFKTLITIILCLVGGVIIFEMITR